MPDAGEVLEMLRQEELVDLPPGAGPLTDLFAAGLDSMAVMQLIVVVEERWGVVLGPADVGRENLGTAAAIAELVSLRAR